MGNGEVDTSAKPKTSAPQEQPPASTATVYPDWSAIQAFYNPGTPPIPPPGFFHSSVASSPQAHPYMWGPQHIIPPYGTPPHPYVAMYPHGGLYAHPSMPPGSHPFSPYAIPSPNGNPEASGSAPAGVEGDRKSSEGKERSPLNRSKGSLGSLNMLTGKNDLGKTSGASANGAYSQSGESGSEGSSEGSDANSQNGSQQKAHCGQGSLESEASQNGSNRAAVQNGIPRTPPQAMMNHQTMAIMAMQPTAAPGGVTGPTTNLNIGMDYWGGPAASAVPALHGKIPTTPVAGAVVPSGLVGSRDGVPSELWLQDERELKRQRRKQSNRESARRSRMRKQAECEELAQRVDLLKEENTALKAELGRVRQEVEQLATQNASLKWITYHLNFSR
ncbi:hypothetical protein AMTR_s00048p00108400 [Amborella trichopoda]|uniref:BZIP domain-containing protein n=1 Tax=Amborella trichopoda TaxID=13333 RepID=U5CZF7_AMBTC|nr:hypothetical protein AMTR_s00048p00108400 [Amborella trichopoda]